MIKFCADATPEKDSEREQLIYLKLDSAILLKFIESKLKKIFKSKPSLRSFKHLFFETFLKIIFFPRLPSQSNYLAK